MAFLNHLRRRPLRFNEIINFERLRAHLRWWDKYEFLIKFSFFLPSVVERGWVGRQAPIPAMSKLNSSLNDGKVVVVDVHADDCHAHTHDLLIRLKRAEMAKQTIKIRKTFRLLDFNPHTIIRRRSLRKARLDSCVREWRKKFITLLISLSGFKSSRRKSGWPTGVFMRALNFPPTHFIEGFPALTLIILAPSLHNPIRREQSYSNHALQHFWLHSLTPNKQIHSHAHTHTLEDF